MASQADRQEPTAKGYHTGSQREEAALVISRNARERLLVGSDAPDVDGLADAEVPVHHDRFTVTTDVNGLAFPEEGCATVHGRPNAKAQIQQGSFTATEIFQIGEACRPARKTEMPHPLPNCLAKRHRQ
jgi:hypothetical protein